MHLVLASKIPQCAELALLCCVNVIPTALRVIAAPGMHLTTRLLPPLKTDIGSSLRLSTTEQDMHRPPVVSCIGSNPILSTAEASGQTDTKFHEIWIKPRGAYSTNARGLQNILGSIFLIKFWKIP